jgi:hypothetical protein
MTNTPAQKAASALGKLGRGKRKTLTPEQRQRQAERLAEARKKRWPKESQEKE